MQKTSWARFMGCERKVWSDGKAQLKRDFWPSAGVTSGQRRETLARRYPSTGLVLVVKEGVSSRLCVIFPADCQPDRHEWQCPHLPAVPVHRAKNHRDRAHWHRYHSRYVTLSILQGFHRAGRLSQRWASVISMFSVLDNVYVIIVEWRRVIRGNVAEEIYYVLFYCLIHLICHHSIILMADVVEYVNAKPTKWEMLIGLMLCQRRRCWANIRSFLLRTSEMFCVLLYVITVPSPPPPEKDIKVKIEVIVIEVSNVNNIIIFFNDTIT